MAGIDPIALAMLDAALNLGVPADVLQSQLSIGDLLTATILAPKNGQDLIEILGRQVAAQLPPGVHPGEVLVLQVTGFDGNQILVRNLGPYDPANPVPASTVEFPESASPQSATLITVTSEQQQQPPAQAPRATPAIGEPAQPSSASLSPPRAVFVAASVRPANLPPAEQARAAVQAPQNPVQNVEARIAAAQAAKTLPEKLMSAPVARPAAAAPSRVPQVAQAALQTAANAAARVLRGAGDVLKLLRLPETPLARAAASIAPQAAARLPEALARLQASLPESSDPRIATLRTIAAFVARMNPQHEETLAAQISAYVSHVIEGGEAKLTQLLQALRQTADPAAAQALGEQPPADGQAAPQTAEQPAATQRQTGNAPVQMRASVPGAALPNEAAARVAERSAAIDHDLKSVVLSLFRNPPAERTPAFSAALSETLVTLTGTQIDALSQSAQQPGTIAFALPVFFRDGGQPAQLRISRDAAGRNARLDADNFHIAFVLETANLGTVAIDLNTTGRSVNVEVKTENDRGASQFARTLDALRGRLETLRYRVGSATAAVAARSQPAAKRERPVEDPQSVSSAVDMRA